MGIDKAKKKQAHDELTSWLERIKLDRAEDVLEWNDRVHELYGIINKYSDIIPQDIREKVAKAMEATDPRSGVIKAAGKAASITKAGLGTGMLTGLLATGIVATVIAASVISSTYSPATLTVWNINCDGEFYIQPVDVGNMKIMEKLEGHNPIHIGEAGMFAMPTVTSIMISANPESIELKAVVAGISTPPQYLDITSSFTSVKFNNIELLNASYTASLSAANSLEVRC